MRGGMSLDIEPWQGRGLDGSGQVLSREAAAAHWPWLVTDWSESPPHEGLYPEWTGEALVLKFSQKDARSSVSVDFLNGAQARRLNAVTGEALTRAIGCQKGLRPAVFDATAGLGGDSSVLANVGCAVLACERQPLVAALLADGLRRAEAAGLPWVVQLRFRWGDALQTVTQVDHGVVYLDPMFPKERKAQPGLAMQWLHALEDTDLGAEVLLEAALDSGASRVVVKRPLKAPPLSGPAPASEIRAKTVRFDLYPRRKLGADDVAAHGVDAFR